MELLQNRPLGCLVTPRVGGSQLLTQAAAHVVRQPIAYLRDAVREGALAISFLDFAEKAIDDVVAQLAGELLHDGGRICVAMCHQPLRGSPELWRLEPFEDALATD